MLTDGAPKIAVIVPVHNAARYLPACLDAIAAQSFADFVCLLIDDGSTDGSPALCGERAAQDARFVVLRQKQAGVSAARAAGVRAGLARGAAWLAFCDADDLWHRDLLRTLHGAARSSGLPLACCRYDTFADAPPQEQPAPSEAQILRRPEHLERLLHSHTVDFGLWNKLYAAALLPPEAVDNGLAFNEDLLANWHAFSAAPGCAFCDWAGYHYRQHADSASHRPLSPQSIDDQRHAALYIREHAEPDMRRSADAFYYEKLVYLASMILRRADAEDYRAQFGELQIAVSAGLHDARLGRNPRLPFSVRMAAWATAKAPGLWQRVCQTMLKDRQ